MEVDIFLNLGTLSNLGLCPRHTEYYVVSLWVLFDPEENADVFVLVG